MNTPRHITNHHPKFTSRGVPAARKLAAAVATLACLLGSVRAAETVEIKGGWPAGKIFTITMTHQTKTSDAPAGAKAAMMPKIDIESEYTVSIPPIHEGVSRISFRVARMAITTDMLGDKHTFDSANPDADADNPMKISIMKIAGKTEVAVVNERGELAFAPDSPASPDSKGGKPSAKMVARFCQGMFRGLPGKAVKIGDSWPFESKTGEDSFFASSAHGICSLKSIGMHRGVRCAEILIDGTEEVKPTDKPFPVAGFALEMTCSVKGTQWFDLDLGMLREMETEEKTTAWVRKPEDPEDKLKTTTTSVSKFAITKIEDLK